MNDANGGSWLAGTEIAPLVPGAASMVFGRDGSLRIETWPGGTPGPEIAAVRQNLALLVDGGEVTADAGAPDTSLVWGRTLGNSAFVWRSAIGTRADGTVVFIVGPALNVATAASLAHDAGCQRAMELDINKDWTSYIWDEHKGGTAVPHQLTSDQLPDAGRYLTTSTREFVAVLRTPPSSTRWGRAASARSRRSSKVSAAGSSTCSASDRTDGVQATLLTCPKVPCGGIPRSASTSTGTPAPVWGPHTRRAGQPWWPT